MKEYTAEQMDLWGNVNMLVGVIAITAAHFIMLLLGFPPLDLVFQGVILMILIPLSYISYRAYKQTKELKE